MYYYYYNIYKLLLEEINPLTKKLYKPHEIIIYLRDQEGIDLENLIRLKFTEKDLKFTEKDLKNVGYSNNDIKSYKIILNQKNLKNLKNLKKPEKPEKPGYFREMYNKWIRKSSGEVEKLIQKGHNKYEKLIHKRHNNYNKLIQKHNTLKKYFGTQS